MGLEPLTTPYPGFSSLPESCPMLPAWLPGEHREKQLTHTYVLLLKAAKGTWMQIY